MKSSFFVFAQFAGALSLPRRDLSTYVNNPVFTSGSDWTPPGTYYGRSIQLDDSSILTTWENYSPEPPLVYFPIFRSEDYGKTYSEISKCTDQVRNMGLRYQPDMYQLPSSFANFSAGTVFLSGNAIPSDLSSTHIELYASKDRGLTWEFVSHIANGGEAKPDNGLTPVWEPFIFFHEDTLTVFYSDQRDPAHGQKLVHQSTTDGINWGPVVTDVAYSNYTARPGMPTIAQLKDGRWIMTYEFVNAPQGGIPIYYKLSDDPLSWDDKEPLQINPPGNAHPYSSPYVVVAEDGKIMVSSNENTGVFVNQGDAAADGWKTVPTEQDSSYSRCLTLVKQQGQDKQYLFLTSGGEFPANGSVNTVTVGLLDFSDW